MKLDQEPGILNRVGDHFGHERPFAPIRLLVALVQFHPESLLQDRRESQLLFAEKLAGDHGVEQVAHLDAEIPMKRPDVVVGPVKDLADCMIGQHGGKRRKLGKRQGIDQNRLPGGGKLDQADPFLIMVKGVRLQVER